MSDENRHPTIEAILRERLNSSYNVLREPAHPALLATLEQIKELLGSPFDDTETIECAKLVSVTLLASLTQLHYELQSKLRSSEAAEVATLIDHALKISQEVHKFADVLS